MAHDDHLMNLYSVTRIALTLGPSLGFLLYLHHQTVEYRADILDKDYRIEDTKFKDIDDYYDFIIIGMVTLASPSFSFNF